MPPTAGKVHGDWGVRPIELPKDLPPQLARALDRNHDGFIAGVRESYIALLNLTHLRYDPQTHQQSYARFEKHADFLEKTRQTFSGIDLIDQTVTVYGERVHVDADHFLGGFELFAIKEGLRAYPPQLAKKMIRGGNGEPPLRLFVGTREAFVAYAKQKLPEIIVPPDLLERLRRDEQDPFRPFFDQLFYVAGVALEKELSRFQKLRHIRGHYLLDLNVVWEDSQLFTQEDFLDDDGALLSIAHEPGHAANDVAAASEPRLDRHEFSEGRGFEKLCKGQKPDHLICNNIDPKQHPDNQSSEVLAYSLGLYLFARSLADTLIDNLRRDRPELIPFFDLADSFLAPHLEP